MSKLKREYGAVHAPKNFFDALAESMTSTTPGRRASMLGTWLARIPMSPVAAARFTCTTSADVKMAYTNTSTRQDENEVVMSQ